MHHTDQEYPRLHGDYHSPKNSGYIFSRHCWSAEQWLNISKNFNSLYTPLHSFIFLPWFSRCSFLTSLPCITFPRPLTQENIYFVLLPEPQGKTVWQRGEHRSMQLSLRAKQNWVGGHTPSPTWKTLMHPPQPAQVGATFIDSSMTRTRYCYTKNENRRKV